MLEFRAVVVAQNVAHVRVIHAGFELVEVEETLVVRRAGRILQHGQQRVQLHGDESRVDHAPLGGTGVYADALNVNLRARGVEALEVDLAERAAVHRIAKLRAKRRNVKQVNPAANLLIRRERDSNLPVFRRIRREQALR
ncbi:hypothetical protein SDC9_177981 [bioreactor metagenome]|uniref:Uncharacterized protein n=1 Tax=bioreactor metagenome TaxID=1076179 RepID=A0A645GVY2_9ZZZZ